MKRLLRMGAGVLVLLASLAFAQSNPVSVETEAFIVSTGPNGQESLAPAAAPRPGDIVEYRVKATNNGETTLPAETVQVAMPLPENTSYLPGTATPSSDRVRTEFSADGGNTWTPAGTAGDAASVTSIRWTLLAPLEPGASETFSFRVEEVQRISVETEPFIVSEVTTENGDKQEKFTPAETARPGQVVEYRVRATNVGKTTLEARTVVVTGPIPDGMHYLDGSATPSSEERLTEFSADGGNSWSEPPVMVDGEPAAPESYSAVRWTLLDALQPGQSATFVYRVVVE